MAGLCLTYFTLTYPYVLCKCSLRPIASSKPVSIHKGSRDYGIICFLAIIFIFHTNSNADLKWSQTADVNQCQKWVPVTFHPPLFLPLIFSPHLIPKDLCLPSAAKHWTYWLTVKQRPSVCAKPQRYRILTTKSSGLFSWACSRRNYMLTTLHKPQTLRLRQPRVIQIRA